MNDTIQLNKITISQLNSQNEINLSDKHKDINRKNEEIDGLRQLLKKLQKQNMEHEMKIKNTDEM